MLGLSTKDLAPVFRITRQDLYHFCDHPERFGAFHRQRFLAVSEQINRLSSILQVSPGSRAKHLVIEGDTLLGLLSAPELDPGRIERVAALLAEHVRHSSSPHQRHQRTIDQLTRHA
ncbi:hypothetical protein CKO33_12735 [Ectothiorhodospira mobilis]|nr:hypothetical protein [Ectothiorhodospira mobilis]